MNDGGVVTKETLNNIILETTKQKPNCLSKNELDKLGDMINNKEIVNIISKQYKNIRGRVGEYGI